MIFKKIIKRINLFRSSGWSGKPVKAYINWINANYRMMLRKEVTNARPVKLTIDTTNICPLHCYFCPTGKRLHDRPPGKADVRLVENLLREIGEYVFFIDFFNWGEPLLNRDVLFRWIEISKQYHIYTKVSSNLSIPLQDDDITRLVKSGLNELLVSLDGVNAGDYGNYRRNGDFDLVVKNMRSIIKKKKELGSLTPRVVWSFIVFGYNEPKIEEAKKLGESWGVDEVLLSLPIVSEDPEKTINWIPSDKKYQLNCNCHLLPNKPKSARCDWHYLSATISHDGSIQPCCAVFYKKDDFGTLGSDGTRSFMKEYNNENYRSARFFYKSHAAPILDICCNTRCNYLSLLTYGDSLNKTILMLLFSDIFSKIFRKLSL